ncbi:hypothetical protein JCM11641_005060 [Rhodosporidiobolus odoratus]
MGVPKLWEELEPACTLSTWAQLAEVAFQVERQRGLRLGVDVSGWLFHMNRMSTIVDADGNVVNVGANSDLRLVFFRLCLLLSRGVLPVFIFDGPSRPPWKRGQRIGGQAWAGRSPQVLKRMFGLFGVEWRVAAGEAEAELARMNERGEVDAVLSDDVDAFLFGAVKIVRNPSKGLSSNKSKTALARTASGGPSSSQPSSSQPSSRQPSASQPSLSQASLAHLPVDPTYANALPTYTASSLLSTTGLSSDSLILVALLAGGDYLPTGFRNVGITIAVALATAGYASSLLSGVRRIGLGSDATGRPGMQAFLDSWRMSVASELRTKKNKLFKTRHLKLADELEAAEEFPSLQVIEYYLSPVISVEGIQPPLRWDGRIDMPGLVEFCQEKFEWGNEEMQARARSLLWLPLGMEALRVSALSLDSSRSTPSVSRPAGSPLTKGWITGVSELKVANSTDYAPAYRVELNPTIFDRLIYSALPNVDPYPFPDYSLMSDAQVEAEKARRKELGRLENAPKKAVTTSYRHWVAVGFAVEGSELYEKAEEWEEERARKKREKEDAEQAKRERAAARAAGESGRRSGTKSPNKAKAAKGKGKNKVEEDSEEDSWLVDAMQKEREAMLAARKGGNGKGAMTHTRRKSLLDESDDDVLLPPKPSTAAAKGKGKAKAPVSVVLSSSPGPSSDLEPPPLSLKASSQRPPKPAAPSLSSAFFSSKPAITSSFSSSKPSVASTSASAKAPRGRAAGPFNDLDDDIFGSPFPSVSSSKPSQPSKTTSFPRAFQSSSKPSTTTKRALSLSSPSRADVGPPISPIPSSASSDDGLSRRTIWHVTKASRSASSQKSPKKTRPVASPLPPNKGNVIDLCGLSSDEEDRDELPIRRRSEKMKLEGEKQESMSEFWARRKREQEEKKNSGSQGRGQVLVLSDSD